MRQHQKDAAALAISLAAFGFGVVLIGSPYIPGELVQPILAIILIVSGIAALAFSQYRGTKKSTRKDVQ